MQVLLWLYPQDDIAIELPKANLRSTARNIRLPSTTARTTSTAGKSGLTKSFGKARQIDDDKFTGVRFTYTSPDGEEGYPGKCRRLTDYRLTNDNELMIDLYAETDADTHVNMTNHNYWNLSGAGSGPILKHQLEVNADKTYRLRHCDSDRRVEIGCRYAL